MPVVILSEFGVKFASPANYLVAALLVSGTPVDSCDRILMFDSDLDKSPLLSCAYLTGISC